MKKKSLYEKIIIGAFLAVPIFSSFISTIHVISLFNLGNVYWIAVTLAIIFEVGQLSSFLVLSVLDKINKTVIWFIFILLATMQIIGNVYYTFNYITEKLIEHHDWLNSAIELINKFTYTDINIVTGKFIISLIISVPIPLISIAFLKSLTDYLKVTKNTNDIIEPKEELKEELKKELKKEPKEEIKKEIKEEIKEEVKKEVKEEPKEEIKDLSDFENIAKNYSQKKYIDDIWKELNDKENTKLPIKKPDKEKIVDLGKIKGIKNPVQLKSFAPIQNNN